MEKMEEEEERRRREGRRRRWSRGRRGESMDSSHPYWSHHGP
jgi:hypothetical protein